MSFEKHIMKRKKVPFLSFVLLGILIMGMAQKNHQTLVIVTHDQELAEYADRIVVLQDGKIEKIQKRIREKKENVYE